MLLVWVANRVLFGEGIYVSSWLVLAHETADYPGGRARVPAGERFIRILPIPLPPGPNVLQRRGKRDNYNVGFR